MAEGRERASAAANTLAAPNTMIPILTPQYSRVAEPSPRNRLWIPEVVRVWWILVVHLFLCITIAVIMTLRLSDYQALDSADGEPWELGTKRYRLRVSEVTTIISAALVAVRICVTSWTVITVWMCAFILMEEGQIKPSQLSYMMDFRVPFSTPKSRVGWVVVSVILLLFPQSFNSPLVTGAVGWSASTQLGEAMVVDINFNARNGDSLDRDIKDALNISREDSSLFDRVVG